MRKLRGIACGWLLLLLTLPAAFPQNTDPNDLYVSSGDKSLENTLVGNEKQLAESEKTKDPTFLKKALANDMIYVAFNGLVFTKDKIVRDLTWIDVNTYNMENFKVRQLGRDAALLTYDLVEKGNIAGHGLPRKSYASSVWVRKSGKWILVFHQDTPAHHS